MSARPRIIHVYKDYWPPVVGGIERCINWMAHGAADKYDVTVLANSRSLHTRERFDGPVRVIEVGEFGRVSSAPVSPSLVTTMKSLEADLWHFHIPNPTGDLAWLMARPKGAVVATYHSDVVRQVVARQFYGPFLSAFLRNCDLIMPTSPRLIDASPHLSRVRERCEAIPLGIPQRGYARTPEKAEAARRIRQSYGGRPLLIFVGRLRYYKGLQFAISAMQQIKLASFLIVGDGPERPRLERLARQLDVASRVHFLGELPDPDVVRHLMASDIFLLPSHLNSEAFGLSQVEAMACGLPVICCDLPTGVPWVNQHEVTGLVVPRADPDALANAIRQLLSDSARRFRMGEAALRRANSELSVQRMVDRVLDAYRRVLSAGRNASVRRHA